MKSVKLLLFASTLSLLLSGCIGVNREFKNIRSHILNNLEDKFDRQIEFSVGPVGFFLASKFVKFAETEKDLDQILANVNNIHVGVYDRLSNFSQPSLKIARVLESSILNDNWYPIVKAIDGDELVCVFVNNFSDADINELFVISLTSDELVLVKLQGELGDIIDIFIRNNGHNFRLSERS